MNLYSSNTPSPKVQAPAPLYAESVFISVVKYMFDLNLSDFVELSHFDP